MSPVHQLYVSLTAVVVATAVVTLVAFWRWRAVMTAKGYWPKGAE